MMNERMKNLLQYLDTLTTLKANGYVCHKEISECIDWIKEGLKPDESNRCKECGEEMETVTFFDSSGPYLSSTTCKCKD